METPSLHVVRIRVSGLVQGVFYRETTRREAEAAGVAGWVRNLPDGSVLAHVEGSSEGVERLSAWMAQGPPSARVDAIEVEPAVPEGCTGFVVQR